MKKTLLFLLAIMTTIACSSGNDPIVADGPDLSASELGAIVVKQIYLNDGVADDYDGKGQFTVYLRDAETKKEMGCVGALEGMNRVSKAGIYYGGLHIPFREVEGNRPNSSLSFEIVFVERDTDEDCPKVVTEGADIVGVSKKLGFSELFNTRIWATNGKAAIFLEQAIDDEAKPLSRMTPVTSDNLVIDKIYFEDNRNEQTKYFLYLNTTNECYDDLKTDFMEYSNVIYSNINLSFSNKCVNPNESSFKETPIFFTLFKNRSDGPVKIAETETKKVGEMIGQKISFKDGKGYLIFAAAVVTPFSLQDEKIRLSELSVIKLTNLKHASIPSIGANLELHFVNAEGGYSLSCTGEKQGLTGINAQGAYNPNSDFVAVSGQRELFGYEKVILKLIERKDGLSCPDALNNTPTELASSVELKAPYILNQKISMVPGAEAEIKLK